MSLLLRDNENYGNVYIDAGTIAEIGCGAYDADTVIDASAIRVIVWDTDYRAS